MAGDLSKLTPADRTQYYLALCQSIGLNWLSRPFIVMKTQDGSMQWYATVGCAEQLRKRDRVSMRIVSREHTADGMYIVTVEASTPDGRVEQAQGIVALAEPRMVWKKNAQGDSIKVEEKTSSGEPILVPLTGKARENAFLRCESKAKRRATLAICGLGLHVAEAESGQEVRFDPQTGALEEPSQEAEPAPAPQPVGREQAQRLIGEMFDRSEGRPEEARA
jgi:hypothetical protein